MANLSGFEDFSGLLLHVYRLSHEQPLQAFQDEALDALRRVLPFDSSMWGSATPGAEGAGIQIHTLHLHRQPPDMLAGYEEVKHLDSAAASLEGLARATRAFDRDVEFAAPQQKAIRAHGRRFDMRHFFISSEMNPASGLVQWVTLYRAHETAHCTETERSLLAAVAPHLQQAMGYNRVRHFDRVMSMPEAGLQPPAAGRAQAVADLRGMVYHATPLFGELAAREWPGARESSMACLPEPLMQALRAGHLRHSGRTLVLRCHAEHGLLFLKARPRCVVDGLSPREHQVAWLLARGLTHKEVARQLGRSPATVRNQVQSIYARLEISSVAQLVALLHEAID